MGHFGQPIPSIDIISAKFYNTLKLLFFINKRRKFKFEERNLGIKLTPFQISFFKFDI
jgi:hypothetical protein